MSDLFHSALALVSISLTMRQNLTHLKQYRQYLETMQCHVWWNRHYTNNIAVTRFCTWKAIHAWQSTCVHYFVEQQKAKLMYEWLRKVYYETWTGQIDRSDIIVHETQWTSNKSHTGSLITWSIVGKSVRSMDHSSSSRIIDCVERPRENYYLHWTLTHRCFVDGSWHWVRCEIAIVIVRRHLRGVRKVSGTFLLGVDLDLLI